MWAPPGLPQRAARGDTATAGSVGLMGQLVECRACRSQISREAHACPRCGAPVRRGIGLGKILGLGVVALIVVGAVGAAGKKDKQRQEVATPTTPPVAPGKKDKQRQEVATPTTPPVEVSATRLASDYKENEVNADELYRGKVLRVSGVVDSIKKGITDKPYVVIKTDNQFMGVHANFDDSAGLSGLAAGKQITVRCIGNNVVMGSPMLKDCVLE
jgi:hypothetical protein